jgi:hypothetical protein
MAIELCRDCSGRVSTEAAHCPHCGVPGPTRRAAVQVATASPPTGAAFAGRAGAEMKCPACASVDVKKVSLLFESGTKITQSVAVGITSSGEVGSAVIGGVGQSLLASRLRPPVDPHQTALYSAAAVAIIALAVFLIGGAAAGASSSVMMVLLLITACASIGTYYFTDTRQRPAYNVALTGWNKQWCCMRCGRVFA